MIAWGMTGNYIYYKHAKKKILEVRNLHPSSDVSLYLSQIGDVNRWVWWVAIIIASIFILLIAAAILIPLLVGERY